MVESARLGRVDRRLDRGRRADARVQPDPAAQAPVQHPLPRRQVLPVPGADGGGEVAAGAGAPGSEAQGRALLRAVRARLGDPRHARRADPGVPGPDLLERLLRPARASRTARASTTTSGAAPGPASRSTTGVDRGELPSARRRDGRVPRREHASPSSAGSRRRCGPPPSARSSSRRRGFRDQLFAARRALETPGDGALAAARTWTWWRSPRTTSRRRSRSSSSGAAGCSGASGWVVDRVEDLDRPGLVASFLEQLYMERQEVPPRVLVPACPPTRDSSRHG